MDRVKEAMKHVNAIDNIHTRLSMAVAFYDLRRGEDTEYVNSGISSDLKSIEYHIDEIRKIMNIEGEIQ